MHNAHVSFVKNNHCRQLFYRNNVTDRLERGWFEEIIDGLTLRNFQLISGHNMFYEYMLRRFVPSLLVVSIQTGSEHFGLSNFHLILFQDLIFNVLGLQGIDAVPCY